MAPPAHHEPLTALGPIDWTSIPQDDLPTFLSDTFTSAQTLIDSIPLPTPVKAAAASATGRARSHTDSDVAGRPTVDINHALSGPAQPAKAPSADAVAAAAKLQKEWKEVKVNPRDNPLAINVYKLGAKDGRGSWFARRSVHEGVTFEKFKLGLEREFAESLKVQEGPPGAGKIRGIGADKRVEREVVEGYGKLEVYQLSAQFPGPTTPRDFITLLLTSAGPKEAKRKLPRQFMVVSKPCQHPECPQRSGYIRGQYESVEIIREIPVDKPLRRTRSSIDVSREDARPFGNRDEEVSKEAIIRSAKKVAAAVEDGQGKHKPVSVSFDALSEVPGAPDDDEEEPATAVEWLMVTRSDPGGNVPRYLVERGTPSGIISDAGRLLDWLESIDPEDFAESEDNDFKKEAVEVEKIKHPEGHKKKKAPTKPTGNLVPESEEKVPQAGPGGFYEMIANALGAGVSVVASHMPNIPFSNKGSDSELEIAEEDEEGEEHIESDSDDSSSIHSFASAQESVEGSTAPVPAVDGASTFSGKSDETRSSLTAAQTQHEKELRKLEDRRRKVHERIAKAQERSLARKSTGISEGEGDKDAAAVAKLREKHEKELAKQEEKYKRELRKLEQKKAAEEKKAEERRRKQAEREERGNLALELERARAERDVALKQIDVLKDQVGELQAQNTVLVARLGKAGLSPVMANGGDSWKEFGSGSSGNRSRAGSVRKQSGEKKAGEREEEVKS